MNNILKRIKKIVLSYSYLWWVTVGVGIFYTILAILSVGDSYKGGIYPLSLPFIMFLMWFVPLIAGYKCGKENEMNKRSKK